jgi:co-chaperonin GroES (HSP10)
MAEVAVERTLKTVEERASQLPKPTGYHILCAVPNVDTTFGGKIEKPKETQDVEEQTTIVLYVIELGPQAYMDKTRYPTGPWCRKGDFIICRSYSGTRLKIHGREFRIINDDTVEAVVDNPVGIGRAG